MDSKQNLTQPLRLTATQDFQIVDMNESFRRLIQDLDLDKKDELLEHLFKDKFSTLKSIAEYPSTLTFFSAIPLLRPQTPPIHWHVKYNHLNQIEFMGRTSSTAHELSELNLFKIAFENTATPMVITKMDKPGGRIEFVNKAFEELTGYQSHEILGKNCAFLQGNDRDQEALTELRQALKEGASIVTTLKNYRKDGSLFINELSLSPIYHHDGNVSHYLGIQNDVTNFEKSQETETKINQLRLMASTIKDNIRLLDSVEDIPQIVTQFATLLGGYSGIVHATIHDENIIFESMEGSQKLKDGLSDNAAFNELIYSNISVNSPTILRLGTIYEVDKKEIASELKQYSVHSLGIYPIHNGEGLLQSVFVFLSDKQNAFQHQEHSAIEDVVASLEARYQFEQREQNLLELYNWDTVTGLPNRQYFLELVDKKLDEESRQHKAHSSIANVIHINVTVLNKISHDIQQLELIHKQLSDRLEESLPKDAILGKMESSSFAVFCLTEPSAQNIEISIDQWMKKIFGKVFDGLSSSRKKYRLTPSVGYTAISINEETDASKLLQNAEIASLESSLSEPIIAYNSNMREDFLQQLALEGELVNAIENSELVLHFQPKLNLRKQQIVAVEGLMRWEHPELGTIPPGRFISALETSGLIKKLTTWLLEQAFNASQSLSKKFERPIRVAINISSVQLNMESFESEIKQLIDKYRIKPSDNLIDLEITESFLVSDLELTRQRLELLSSLGFGVAIDDFGTGYSALSYLTSLSYNQLKIDMKFIKDMMTSPNDMALVSSIINLARSMDKVVIAEGVEQVEQAKLLRLLNCHEIQGFLVGKAAELSTLNPGLESSMPDMLH